MQRKLGLKPDKADPRDKKFGLTLWQKYMPEALMPASVDLRSLMPPIMDQGQLSSCVAHGVTAALRYNMINMGHTDTELSRLQLYYDARALENDVDQDEGCQIRDAVKSAAQVGVAQESLWPYDVTRVFVKPVQAVYDNAAKFEALDYERVNVNVRAVKVALVTGRPVIIGVNVYRQFDDVAIDGLVALPGLFERPVGGHCMLVVGYGQVAGCFTVRNSWGTDWGDQGYCYIPEAYIQSQGSDYWVISTNKGD